MDRCQNLVTEAVNRKLEEEHVTEALLNHQEKLNYKLFNLRLYIDYKHAIRNSLKLN